jgi:hypothetical protein
MSAAPHEAHEAFYPATSWARVVDFLRAVESDPRVTGGALDLARVYASAFDESGRHNLTHAQIAARLEREVPPRQLRRWRDRLVETGHIAQVEVGGMVDGGRFGSTIQGFSRRPPMSPLQRRIDVPPLEDGFSTEMQEKEAGAAEGCPPYVPTDSAPTKEYALVEPPTLRTARHEDVSTPSPPPWSFEARRRPPSFTRTEAPSVTAVAWEHDADAVIVGEAWADEALA